MAAMRKALIGVRTVLNTIIRYDYYAKKESFKWVANIEQYKEEAGVKFAQFLRNVWSLLFDFFNYSLFNRRINKIGFLSMTISVKDHYICS